VQAYSQKEEANVLNKINVAAILAYQTRNFLTYFHIVFSSFELKAQASFSDRPLSSVRLFVRPSVCKLLHFLLLLQNHWANLTTLGTNHL
jgi:hypothetical protein